MKRCKFVSFRMLRNYHVVILMWYREKKEKEKAQILKIVCGDGSNVVALGLVLFPNCDTAIAGRSKGVCHAPQPSLQVLRASPAKAPCGQCFLFQHFSLCCG